MNITKDQASALIDYMEELFMRTDHQTVMVVMMEQGYSEEALDKACKALGKIAERDFGIL